MTIRFHGFTTMAFDIVIGEALLKRQARTAHRCNHYATIFNHQAHALIHTQPRFASQCGRQTHPKGVTPMLDIQNRFAHGRPFSANV